MSLQGVCIECSHIPSLMKSNEVLFGKEKLKIWESDEGDEKGRREISHQIKPNKYITKHSWGKSLRIPPDYGNKMDI